MWCSRLQLSLALLSIALAVLSVSSDPTDNRHHEILQRAMDQELLKDTVMKLLPLVADADNEAGTLDVSNAETSEENTPPMKFQQRQFGMRMRKNCKNFFWKTYTLC
ncbi:somatostatin-1A-like [Scyliorhinus torazame]|uniref:Somatostatin/Cortistatin C-terminal domain-containing protein n=1 Tax=Scyliorhinus torazame TaxID=75743 RepID=A0A401PQN6_SCYTO|nr:hypothetical protein [Scyliorhinus torazame]